MRPRIFVIAALSPFLRILVFIACKPTGLYLRPGVWKTLSRGRVVFINRQPSSGAGNATETHHEIASAARYLGSLGVAVRACMASVGCRGRAHTEARIG